MARNTQFNVDTLLKSDAARPFYAWAGATDLAVEKARDYVTGAQKRATARVDNVQKRVQDIDFEPKALQARARGLVSARVDELSKEAKARQNQLQAFPGKVEELVSETYADLNDTYADLAKRGEKLVTRIRKQQATQDAKAAAKTTKSRAKATGTSAKKGAKATKTSAKRTGTTAKNEATKAVSTSAKGTGTTAKKQANKTASTAKGAGTAAKKTAAKTATATKTAATKVGDSTNAPS